jgi:hypothetical protein
MKGAKAIGSAAPNSSACTAGRRPGRAAMCSSGMPSTMVATNGKKSVSR